ncbi:MAG: glycosyltransferase family 4 protein [Microcella sp.]|uniref:glycosyltransferase n=1 Tax=Microcella sp. TaxID=1913979 RepID=UPI0024CBDFB4|nr:glycosyltransferase [Microcella sp.]UYN82569.1 MAG: glycosyltransferase family 4 protein [Microcella sp.]
MGEPMSTTSSESGRGEGIPLKILILSYTRTEQEPRIIKQIREFSGRSHVTTAGYGLRPEGVHDHIELSWPPPRKGLARVPGLFSFLLLSRLHRAYSALEPRDRASFDQLKDGTWDVVVAHDAQTLYLASRLRPRYGVLADMHEYAPRQSLPSLRWNLLHQPYYTWLCRTYLTTAAAVTTVSQGIVEEYRREFGVQPVLVVNATPYHELEVGRVGRTIRLVHSGGLAVQRRLDIMIQGVRESAADVTLDLYLVGSESPLMRELKDLAAGDSRIRFLEPVPYAELVPKLNQYDLGLSIFPPTTFNLAWCLPNKFFDFIQARLGVIVGPSPEMSRIVNEYGVGLVLADFEPSSLAKALDALTPEQVAGWKSASANRVRELSGEQQGKIWGSVLDTMVSNGS